MSSVRSSQDGKLGYLMQPAVGDAFFCEDPELDWEKAKAGGSLAFSPAEYRKLERGIGIPAELLGKIIPSIPIADLGDDPYDFVTGFCRSQMNSAEDAEAEEIARLMEELDLDK